jgi:enoyl-CoA hydratase/carnithine racemase
MISLLKATRYCCQRLTSTHYRLLSSTTVTTKPPRVDTTIDSDGICHVVLNRQDKLNSLDLAMFEAIAKTASELRTDRSIRAVIMSGKGRAFCTGLDVVSRKGD